MKLVMLEKQSLQQRTVPRGAHLDTRKRVEAPASSKRRRGSMHGFPGLLLANTTLKATKKQCNTCTKVTTLVWHNCRGMLSSTYSQQIRSLQRGIPRASLNRCAECLQSLTLKRRRVSCTRRDISQSSQASIQVLFLY